MPGPHDEDERQALAMEGGGRDSHRVAAAVGELASSGERCITVATAESLTGGEVATRLGRTAGSGEWFAGGVVAYSPRVKQEVLGVEPGPVVTPECAQQMAEGARRLLGVDVAVSMTGVGGPGEDEGQPAGTVHFAVAGPHGTTRNARLFEGEPDEVVERTVLVALELLESALRELRGADPAA